MMLLPSPSPSPVAAIFFVLVGYNTVRFFLLLAQ